VSDRLVPLPTRDPFGGGELVVTRLESLTTGVTIEGTFTLGWMGRLTPEQLDFLGLLLQRRNNLQKLATDLGVAYNTIRARFEAIIEAVGGPVEPLDANKPDRKEVLRRLAAGELTVDDAKAELES
jgi:hypothetical protein